MRALKADGAQIVSFAERDSMTREISWKRLLIFAVILGSVGIGSAARTPIAHADPFISVTVTVDNTAGDLDLVRAGGQLDHGCWTNDVKPPGVVPAHTSASFEAESCGVATGTEGHVLYRPV